MKNVKQDKLGKKIMKVLCVAFAVYTAFCIVLLLCPVESAASEIVASICFGMWFCIPLFWIGYGIYQIATTEKTIPKVKERMPWDKGSPLSVDDEWRQAIKENKNAEED